MSEKTPTPSSFTVIFQVPASATHPAFQTQQNIWRCNDVQTPEDAIRSAYAMKRRSFQCKLHDDLHKFGRIERIPGYETQVIVHPYFDLQVVRVEANSEGYSGGGMALFEYSAANKSEFTRDSVRMRIRRESFDVLLPEQHQEAA